MADARKPQQIIPAPAEHFWADAGPTNQQKFIRTLTRTRVEPEAESKVEPNRNGESETECRILFLFEYYESNNADFFLFFSPKLLDVDPM